MNRDLVVAWVDALESGRYDQTTSALRDQNGYCCLGVLCDVAASRGDISGHWDHDERGAWVFAYDDDDVLEVVATDLPEKLVALVGLKLPLGHLPDGPWVFMVPGQGVQQMSSLAGANDNLVPFAAIAAGIRERILDGAGE